MFSFSIYTLLTIFLTFSSFYYAFYTRQQFYPAIIYLTQAKLNVVILGNLAFFILLCFGRLVKSMFLGSLTREELDELLQNSKYAITETGLALTIFREEVNTATLALFTALLFVKSFHWLLGIRVENLTRSHNIGIATHLRLFALLLTLAAVDISFAIFIGSTLWSTRTPSVLLLFGFEFLILVVSIWSIFCRYCVYLIDSRLDGRWNSKSSWVFALEFSSDLIRLFLYIVFFSIVCHYYGLPIHLIRELFMTFYTLRERIIKFIHYRRMTANMNERFPDSTQAELDAADDVCIICREAMNAGTAKKLPRCGHHFHTNCLRSWLERSHSCPTCRAEIQPNQTTNPPPVAQPAAAAAVAPELPPLPPRLQAAISQQNRINEAKQAEEKKSEPAPSSTTGSAENPRSTIEIPLSSSFLNNPQYFPYSIASPAIPISSLSLNPLDPLHISLFHHHTLLLQHQIEFLSSSLNQAKILFERQIEFQEKINQCKAAAEAEQEKLKTQEKQEENEEKKEKNDENTVIKTESAADSVSGSSSLSSSASELSSASENDSSSESILSNNSVTVESEENNSEEQLIEAN